MGSISVAGNASLVTDLLKEAAGKGAQLAVFPECSLSGYVFESKQQAMAFAQPVPGQLVQQLAELCRSLCMCAIIGILEKENGLLYNSAVLLGPSGIIGKYRKTHLPYLGVDRFVEKSAAPFRVCETPVGKIGMQICYDLVFPEVSRVLMLRGAEILAVSANFPTGRGEKITGTVAASRAIENRVHIVSANRVGTEQGFRFAGNSRIIDAAGETLACAGPDCQEIIIANLDLNVSRQKHITFIQGCYELDYDQDRRPELYGSITLQRKQKSQLSD